MVLVCLPQLFHLMSLASDFSLPKRVFAECSSVRCAPHVHLPSDHAFASAWRGVFLTASACAHKDTETNFALLEPHRPCGQLMIES